MIYVCLCHRPWRMGVVGFLRNIVADGREIMLPSLHLQAPVECGNFMSRSHRKNHFLFSIPLVSATYLFTTMVVVNSEPSTSAPKRKNRRSLHRKKSAAVSQPTAEKTGVEVDQEMEPVDQEVYEPGSQVMISATGVAVEELGRDQPGDAGDDDEIMIDTDPSTTAGPAPTSAPSFPALTGAGLQTSLKSEMRRIPIPPHRMSPLKKDWINVFGPLTEILGLQVRMNVQRKAVEIRVSVVKSHSVCWYSHFGL